MKTLMAPLFVILLLCSFSRDSIMQSDITKGKEIFESNCAKCHGADGTKGKWGAKNLQLSRLEDANMKTIITNGKRIMPAWRKRLTSEEILSVIAYVKTLRKFQ